MMLAVTGAAALVLRPLVLAHTDVIVISLSVGTRFLAHPALDEIYAALAFDGMQLAPKTIRLVLCLFKARTIRPHCNQQGQNRECVPGLC